MSAAISDPTLTLLDKLEDSSLWDVLPNVPIFVPHERTGKDGSPINVTKSRLKKICENFERNRKSRRIIPRITIGHVKQHPDTPEQNQPDIVGFADNWRIGELEDTPCILADFYFDKAFHDDIYRRDNVLKFPYRSAEFYPASDEITGVALLKRDPQLDMGITYERHREGGSYFYAMGDDMPMAPPGPSAGFIPGAAPPGPTAGPGGGDELYAKFKEMMDRYMAENPEMAKLCGKGKPESADLPKGPGPTEPPASKKPEDAEPMQRSVVAEEYLRMKAEVAKIQAERKAEKEAYNRSQADLIMAEFQRERVIIDNPKAMRKELASMDDAGRQRRKTEVLVNYQRDITGGTFLNPVDLTDDDSAGSDYAPRKEQEFGERDLAVAEEYMRKKPGCDWEEAHEYALKARGNRASVRR